VRVIAAEGAGAELRLRASIDGLADRVPFLSARSLLTKGQKRVLLTVALVIALGLAVATLATLTVLVTLVIAVYVAMIVYRTVLFVWSSRPGVVIVVGDTEAKAVHPEELPSYTIMIPAFHESEVIGQLLEHVAGIDYPTDRLEVMVLVEADDEDTIDAVRRADPGGQFQLVVIPPASPRTKPKALNYGLTLARGELVTVYDAEDEPDPLQLRRAAVALSRQGPDVACLQAKLSYHNPTQNLITRWFTIEYGMWFSYFLPGLARSSAPIPLGGTSNHFRREVLRRIGGWDPYNVTEDADLGIRMHREGYRVRVLESTTYEEANSDFINWMRQRSRWYKGYLQTLLVHLRSPRTFRREVGLKGAAHFCMFVGGTPILAFLNPVFWILTVLWFVWHPAWIQEIFPAPVYYAGLLSWCMGNFLIWYLSVLSCRLLRRDELLWAAVLVPAYWVMMSMAAVKAFWQIVGAPTFWEKTVHGLTRHGGTVGQSPEPSAPRG